MHFFLFYFEKPLYNINTKLIQMLNVSLRDKLLSFIFILLSWEIFFLDCYCMKGSMCNLVFEREIYFQERKKGSSDTNEKIYCVG